MKNQKGNKAMAKSKKESSIQRPVLSVKETAAYLGVGETLIWTQIKAGNLKPLRLGDRVLFSRAYLDRLCEAR
jgi:excisionase family DNA binding protein